jgi:hypothetical protein
MTNCGFNNKFENVNSFNQHSLIAQLEENIKAYLDHSFLCIGGYVNCVTGTYMYGQNDTTATISESSEPSGYRASVWETNHKDWVYETGVSFNNNSPINISGINVNNIFLPSPTGSGNYGYSLNYLDGQIKFDKPIPTTSKVSIEYSYRKCQVYKSSVCNWWGEFKNALYSDISNEHSIHLPAIVIEPNIRMNMKPYQIGGRSFFFDQDINLYVFANSAIERNNIVDMIRLQKEKTLLTYDINSVISNNAYPIHYNGSLNNNGQNYESLLISYPGNHLFIKNVDLMGLESYSKKIFWCILRLTTETIL